MYARSVIVNPTTHLPSGLSKIRLTQDIDLTLTSSIYSFRINGGGDDPVLTFGKFIYRIRKIT